MTIWQLFAEGRTGNLQLGMSASDVKAAFGEPDNQATGADGELRILKYDDIELHFQKQVMFLIHSESWQDTSAPSAFCSARLGIDPAEFLLPVDLEALEARAAEEGVPAQPGTDVFDNPQLTLAYGLITVAEDAFVVSVLDYSLID